MAEEFDHLLLPVKMSSKLYKAMKSSVTKKRDYLMNRQDIEKNLYNASSDLCTAIRPLIEAVSLLEDKEGCGAIKHLIGLGLMGIISSNLKISRGRRELGRSFVRLDCAEALFSVAPSHRSLFGGASNSAAVAAAKEATKLDNSLVHKPRFKRPFRPSYPTTSGFHQSSSHRGQGNRAPQYQQPYNNQYYYQKSSRGQTSGYRGRGRGGRGSKSSSSKTTPKN